VRLVRRIASAAPSRRGIGPESIRRTKSLYKTPSNHLVASRHFTKSSNSLLPPKSGVVFDTLFRSPTHASAMW